MFPITIKNYNMKGLVNDNNNINDHIKKKYADIKPSNIILLVNITDVCVEKHELGRDKNRTFIIKFQVVFEICCVWPMIRKINQNGSA